MATIKTTVISRGKTATCPADSKATTTHNRSSMFLTTGKPRTIKDRASGTTSLTRETSGTIKRRRERMRWDTSNRRKTKNHLMRLRRSSGPKGLYLSRRRSTWPSRSLKKRRTCRPPLTPGGLTWSGRATASPNRPNCGWSSCQSSKRGLITAKKSRRWTSKEEPWSSTILGLSHSPPRSAS